MAIYHVSVKTFNRSRGQSAIAAAAYRLGLSLTDPTKKMKHDYRKKRGIVHTRCFAPPGSPDWVFDPNQLWAAAEALEKRKNSNMAREFEIALPHELSDLQRRELVNAIARVLVDRYGFVIHASIHAHAKGSLNHHVHFLATTRRVDSTGLTDKTRELDGGPAGKAEILWSREMVAETINAHLKAAGVQAQVDHRTLQAQADDALAKGHVEDAVTLTREPTQHMGKDATAMERKGVLTDRGNTNATIMAENAARTQRSLARLRQEARTLPVSARRKHLRTRSTRSLASVPTTPAVSSTKYGLQIGSVQGIRPGVLEALLERREEDPVQPPPKDVTAEATALWTEIAPVLAPRMALTAQVLETLPDRIATFLHQQSFAKVMRELLLRLRRLKHNIGQQARHLETYHRERDFLQRAQWALDQVNALHPSPKEKAKWERQRARRFAAVEDQAQRFNLAATHVSPEGQEQTKQRLLVATVAVELISQNIIDHYPLNSDISIEDGPALASTAPAQPSRSTRPQAPSSRRKEPQPQPPKPPKPRSPR